MKRREFLKSTLPAAALMQAGMPGLLVRGDLHRSDTQDGRAYDLVVVGGSLAGCFAALHAARNGLRVLLIERRTFLGTEITAAMRPWLRRDGFAIFSSELKNLFLPVQEQEEVGVAFDPEGASDFFGDQIPLFMGTIKKQLMQVLQQASVDVLVGTGVWGVLADEKQRVATGLAVANKFGLHVIDCKRVIDTRDQARRSTDGDKRQAAYTLELYGVGPDAGDEVLVPDSLQLANDKILVHKGKRKAGQRFVEFRFVPTQEDVEDEARQRAEAVCAHLISQHKSFARAELQQMAWETLRATGDASRACEPTYVNYESLTTRTSLDLSCQDIQRAYEAACDCVNKGSSAPEPQPLPAFIDCATGRIPLSDCHVTLADDLRQNAAIQQLTIPVGKHVPKTIQADVVVAGGGTAGAMAALGSVREGAKTVTVEYLPELGGTSTVGRVTGYYAAYKGTRFFEFIEDGVNKQKRLAGRCNRGVARMLFYRKQATQAGGTLLTNSIVCGVVKDGAKLTGVIVEREGRLFIVAGEVTIDATGDGDVAAFAGADFAVGNQRMQCTQNYSQWDVNPGVAAWKDSTTNRDYDILWSHKLSEWQRGYQLSHQQASYYDFSPFLTVRECRRIAGQYTITLKDVILDRRHADTICLAQSDFDPHHFGDTVFTRAGCLLPHQVSAVVEIPYRSILPRGIDNLLVSAKAISQTHNAQQFTRMSFDIMTLGYVTGRIAACIVKQGVRPREFDVSELQDELRQWKILPPAAPTVATPGKGDARSMASYIDALMAGEQNSLLKIMLQAPQAAREALRHAYEQATEESQQLRLAKALAWFGSDIGRQLIVNEMKELFEKERASGVLPREYYREDQDTPYWTINQDIALLSLRGDVAVLPDILALADALPLGNAPVKQATSYNRGRIDLRLIPFYNRIVTICFAIERTPHASAVGSLCRFLDDPFIGNHICRQPEQAGDKVFGGILESRLAATLARCGAKRGVELLVEYRNDIHPMLTHYASQELTATLGVDHGCDDQQWRRHIERLKFPLPPTPLGPNAIEI